jgi:hypothetical protein
MLIRETQELCAFGKRQIIGLKVTLPMQHSKMPTFTVGV